MIRTSLLAAAFLAVAAAAAAAPPYRAPRTASGAPDLGGLWTNASLTPLQRPKGFATLTTTEAQARAFEVAVVREFNEEQDGVGGRQSEWWDMGEYMTRIGGQVRTSLIVDPPDGRLPYNEAGLRRVQEGMSAPIRRFDGPEVRPAPERCVAGGGGASGVPMFPPRYNGNYMMVQTPEHLAVWSEMGSGVRLIHLKPGTRPPPSVRLWQGYSAGRWEGETLVVETTNLHPGDTFKTPAPIYISEHARVVERFTRISSSEILYVFEVEDPAAYTRPWRGELVFRATKGPIFENACHEGNYALPGILAGARYEEKQAAGR
ncbi:hypothetical protein [Phenylobacterium sp.]|jgi:hypothetical protein|uniref:hypothetical protein n=1 Tax=Phenylobacterium sp. TaxID=1871053 RepID=UPI002F9215CF